MLKLKITTTVLALAGLVLLLMGGTYFTAAAAIVCTAMALPLAFHLTFRWLRIHTTVYCGSGRSCGSLCQ